MSSTMIPIDSPATIDTAKPTWPTTHAQTPNAMTAGSTLGMRLRSPIFTLRRAKIRMNEINRKPRPVPSTIDAMLRRVI